MTMQTHAPQPRPTSVPHGRVRRHSVRKIGLMAAVLAVLHACAEGDGGTTGDDPACEAMPGHICTVVGTHIAGLSPDGHAPTATDLYLPQDATVGPDGLLYVIDWNNHRIRVVRGDIVQTLVGTGYIGDAPDGPADQTSLNHPTHITFEPDGNMIIAAWHNSKVMRYRPSTNTVETICGTGARSFNGDGMPGKETVLDLPVATAVTPDGALLISDQANQRIRRLDHGNIVTTIAGNGTQGYTGDGGPAVNASLNLPVSQSAPPAGRIAIDAGGTIYLADTLNHVIRRIGLDGVITTVAGVGARGNGSGPWAKQSALDSPSDVAVDAGGNLYIADTMNNCIRRVAPDGTIATVAGVCGQFGYEGDGGPATSALLDRPYGIDLARDGTLYVADTHNHVVRAVYPDQ